MWSKLHKNCIIAGPLEALCLLCEVTIKTQCELDSHVQVDIHLKALDTAPYIEKYKPHNIRKVTLGYYCEFCNLVLSTPAKVNLHITIPEHEQNRGFQLVKRINDSVIVFDDISINHRSWNGFVEDTCAICNVEYYDESKHLNLHSHIFNLITNKIEFLGDNMVYRKIDDSSYQCMICNLVLASSTLSAHIEQPGHIKMVEKCRKAGRAILNPKTGTDHALTNSGKDADRGTTNIGSNAGRATTSIGNDADRATTTTRNEAGRAFLNILNPSEKTDEKKKTDNKTKKSEFKKPANNNYMETETFICNVFGAKNYIVSQDDGKSMCLLCDWSMETSVAAAHVAGRHHITILKMHKERLDRMSKDEDSEPESGNASGSSATGNKKDKPEPKDKPESGKSSVEKATGDEKSKIKDASPKLHNNGASINKSEPVDKPESANATGDEKGKIKDASPTLHKNGMNTNKPEHKDKPESGKTNDEKVAGDKKGKIEDTSPKLHDNGGSIKNPKPNDKPESGKATAVEKDNIKDSLSKPHNNGINIKKSEPKEIYRLLPESENACGGSITGDVNKTNPKDESKTQNSDAVSAIGNGRNKIFDSIEEFQSNGISINFVTGVASCKKCFKILDLEYTAIQQHIKEDHAVQRPINPFTGFNSAQDGLQQITKALEGKEEEDTECLKDINKIYLVDGQMYCEFCQTNLPTSFKSVKEHVSGARHQNNLGRKTLSDNPPVLPAPKFDKMKLKDYVISMVGVEDGVNKGVILNEKFDITMMSFLLMSSVNSRCYICDKYLEPGQIDGHKVSEQHIRRVSDSMVLISLENEFVRELRRNAYHCGICSWMAYSWTGMEAHLQSRIHNNQKCHMKWRLTQHLTQVARIQWERSSNFTAFMNVVAERETEQGVVDWFRN